MDLEFMLTKEIGTMREIIEQSGFEVIIATVSGEVIKADSTTITPHIKVDEMLMIMQVSFFPCMASDSTHPEVITLIKKAVNRINPLRLN
jgi:hypothetical protein